jgi:hypothetical protein
MVSWIDWIRPRESRSFYWCPLPFKRTWRLGNRSYLQGLWSWAIIYLEVFRYDAVQDLNRCSLPRIKTSDGKVKTIQPSWASRYEQHS